MYKRLVEAIDWGSLKKKKKGKKNLDLVLSVETKVTSNKIDWIKQRIDFVYSFCVEAEGEVVCRGWGLILNSCILIKIWWLLWCIWPSWLLSKLGCYALFMALIPLMGKQSFWELVNNVVDSFVSPWLRIGDFNS